MKVFTDMHDPEVVELLQAGKVGVLRTDTLYGLVARADDEQAVQRIYHLKGRDGDKSPIVLVADKSQLFDEPSPEENSLLDKVWPGRVSVVLASNEAPLWIRRRNQSVAYRMPAESGLRNLLEDTGGLIAPSANPQGEPPAMDADEAINYFGDDVDFYVDGGRVENGAPSRLLRIDARGMVEVLR